MNVRVKHTQNARGLKFASAAGVGGFKLTVQEAVALVALKCTTAVPFTSGASGGGSVTGVPGDVVNGGAATVYGAGFGATQGTGKVEIGTVTQTIVKWTDRRIDF